MRCFRWLVPLLLLVGSLPRPAHAQDSGVGVICITDFLGAIGQTVTVPGIYTPVVYRGAYTDPPIELYDPDGRRIQFGLHFNTNLVKVVNVKVWWRPGSLFIASGLSIYAVREGARSSVILLEEGRLRSGLNYYEENFGFGYFDDRYPTSIVFTAEKGQAAATGGPADIAVQIKELCYRSSAPWQSPTPAPTQTPITHTPTPSPTATDLTHTPTSPALLAATLSSGAFQPPLFVSGECRDLYHPCALFAVPAFPTIDLPSPTRRPTLVYTATPSPTASLDPTASTYTPTPLPTACWDACGTPNPLTPSATPYAIAALSTLSQNVRGFNLSLRDARGTPVGAEAALTLGTASGTLFSLIRTLANADLGPVGWLISFIVLALALDVLFWVMPFFIPIFLSLATLLMNLLGLLLRVVRR